MKNQGFYRRETGPLHIVITILLAWSFISVPLHHHDHGEQEDGCHVCLKQANCSSFVLVLMPPVLPEFTLEIYQPIFEDFIPAFFHPRNTLPHGPPLV